MDDGRWTMDDDLWSMIYGLWSMVYGPSSDALDGAVVDLHAGWPGHHQAAGQAQEQAGFHHSGDQLHGPLHRGRVGQRATDTIENIVPAVSEVRSAIRLGQA